MNENIHHIHIYIYVYMLPLFVTLKKVYDRNVVNKYGLYSLLGVIIYNLVDYIYIYVYNSKSLDVVQSLYFGSKLPSSGTYK